MNHERVERVVAGYAAFNRGDFEPVLSELNEDVTWEVLEALPEQDPIVGKQEILRFWQSWAETFDEFRAEIEEISAVGDHVVVVMHMAGRMHGSDTEMRTGTFAQLWTWEDERLRRVRMVGSKQEALGLIGEPSDAESGR
jgi:ketosteroid isomerase-like protein